jgi:hypothetical protein
MTVQTSTWALRGGLDLVSPAMSIPAGHAIVAQNYEAAVSGGYSRIAGYALYDGSVSPATPAIVAGSGDILGVWEYNNVVYAFRNNAAGTACVMHKSTASGWAVVTTPTLVAGGSFEFVNHNFTGSSATDKMYGVDGKNKAFQFDGTTFTQLTTGMTTDTPTHVGVHKNHLFLSFGGGSIQHSGVGDPTSWTLNTGAGELGIGSEITNIDSMRGNALVITGADNVSILYGTSTADWDLKTFSTELGVTAKTTEIVDAGLIWFNGRNVTYLQTTQSFGDFNTASLSTPITSYIEKRESLVVGSSINYRKNQYRLFFSDKTVAVATIINNTVVGWTTWLISHTPTALSEKYMGCTDGSVMQLDTGNSFAGTAIESFLRLPFNSFKSSHRKKRFRKLLIEMDAGNEATVRFNVDYDFGGVTTANFEDVVVYGSGGLWSAHEWGSFTWSSTIVTHSGIHLNGTGKNFGLLVYHSSATDPSFTLQGVTVNYSTRGLIK